MPNYVHVLDEEEIFLDLEERNEELVCGLKLELLDGSYEKWGKFLQIIFESEKNEGSIYPDIEDIARVVEGKDVAYFGAMTLHEDRKEFVTEEHDVIDKLKEKTISALLIVFVGVFPLVGGLSITEELYDIFPDIDKIFGTIFDERNDEKVAYIFAA